MTLFSRDLYRNFAIGFAVGALIVGATNADQWSDNIGSPAHAAEQVKALAAPQPSDDFWKAGQ